MNDDTTNTCGAIGAVLIGGLIGAAITLLLAPRSGRETRKDIKRLARRSKYYAGDLMEEAIDDVNLLVKDLRARAADVADQGTELTDKAKKEIIATLEQGQRAIEKQKQKFTETFGL